MSDSQTDTPDLLGALVQAAFDDDELATECRSPEWWYEHEAGYAESLEDQELAVLSAHADSCTRCSAERKLARSFLKEQRASQGLDNLVSFPSTTPSTAHSEPQQQRNSLIGWLAAAAVVLAVFGTYAVTQSRAPGILAPGTGAVLRSQVIEAVQPTGTLTEVPSGFSWADHNQLGPYRLVVTRVDGRVVFEGTAEATSLILSEQDQARFEPAVRYRWTVEATTANGATVQSLPLDFRIAP